MQIIAKTANRFLIEATESEVSAIMNACSMPITNANPVVVGMKLPALDYSATIARAQAISNSNGFRSFKSWAEDVTSQINRVVQEIGSINITKDIEP